MNILVKQIDKLVSTRDKDSEGVGEYLIYLMGNTGRPLSAQIVYGEEAKKTLINDLLAEHFIPNDWENNKESFDIKDVVKEVSYEEYINNK